MKPETPKPRLIREDTKDKDIGKSKYYDMVIALVFPVLFLLFLTL